MNRYIRTAENYYLSDDDLRKATNGRCNIVLYDDIENYSSIDEILGENNCAFVLIELFSKTSGHWVFIQRNNHGILEWFDPYGHKPDYYIFNNKHHKNKNGGFARPHLTFLLLENNESLIYNPFKFQNVSKNISTCGRWVLLRFKFRNIKIRDFIKLFKKDTYKLTRDNLAVLLTSMLF